MCAKRTYRHGRCDPAHNPKLRWAYVGSPRSAANQQQVSACRGHLQNSHWLAAATAEHEEDVMVLPSRMIMGIAMVIGAGAVTWGSLYALRPMHPGTVEIRQLDARSWAVEISQRGTESVVVHSQPGTPAQ
jgi:hypothetical protein